MHKNVEDEKSRYISLFTFFYSIKFAWNLILVGSGTGNGQVIEPSIILINSHLEVKKTSFFYKKWNNLLVIEANI